MKCQNRADSLISGWANGRQRRQRKERIHNTVRSLDPLSFGTYKLISVGYTGHFLSDASVKLMTSHSLNAGAVCVICDQW